MIKRSITISNKLGLHARASAKLTQAASQFACAMWISRAGRRGKAKSIMGGMMPAGGLGSTVAAGAAAPDEGAARALRDRYHARTNGERH